MAGAGYKLFQTGDVLTAAQVNTYLNEQTVMVFASSAARTSALSGVLAEGMMSYLQDTNSVEVYNGTAWVSVGGGGGDVTEVQAGVGISVASGTGPIPVVTNTMATAIDAAGDLIYGTGADTFARLGIGTAGQVLKVNAGATAPEWGAASSTPTFKGVYTYIASDQTLSNNTSTAINYDTELFDTDAFHNNATNKDRITIPAGLGGYYLIVVGAQWNSNSSGYRQITIQKNATSNVMIFDYPGLSVSNSYIGKSTIFNLTAGDYINAVGYQNSGGNLALGGGSVATFFSVQYLGV
jgi:hypothetical protein